MVEHGKAGRVSPPFNAVSRPVVVTIEPLVKWLSALRGVAHYCRWRVSLRLCSQRVLSAVELLLLAGHHFARRAVRRGACRHRPPALPGAVATIAVPNG